MSGKSKRRGRHLSRSQRRKLGREVSTPATSAPSAASKPAPSPRAAAPVPAAKAAVTKTLAPSRNVSGELKRIGVVGGIMVVILVVTYFVLPLILA